MTDTSPQKLPLARVRDVQEGVSLLAERLERLKGPDREVDQAIADYHVGTPRTAIGGDARYTGSIDAALTLIPEEWASDIWMKRYGGHHWAVDIHIPSYQLDARHAHLPIAICIVALRARAAIAKAEGQQ